MKTTARQFFFAIPTLLIIVIVCNSFAPAQKNSMAIGNGVADGIPFTLNAIGKSNGTVAGHVLYNDEFHSVINAEWFGASAILYTADGFAFYVADNAGPSVTDYISDPIPADPVSRVSPADFFGIHYVNKGNIQVK